MRGKVPHRLTEHIKAIAADSWKVCTKAHKNEMSLVRGQNERLKSLLDDAIEEGKRLQEENTRLRDKKKLDLKIERMN